MAVEHFNRMPGFKSRQIEHFWNRVNISTDSECWEWRRGLYESGYGHLSIWIQSKMKTQHLASHRVAYFLHYGIDPADNLVCHHCDNRKCCNPSHLFLGNRMANAQDAKRKGRLKHVRGMKHHWFGRSMAGELAPNSKITEADAMCIIKRYAAGGISQKSIANEYGITQAHVSKIIRRDSWTHLK